MMDNDFGTPVTPVEEKKNNTVLIVVIIIAVVLCCFCLLIAGAVSWLWNNGDTLLRELSGSLISLRMLV